MNEFELGLAEEELIADVQMFIINNMEEQGITRSELAKRLDVSKSAVSQMLSLEPQNLSLRKVARVCAVLDAKISIARQSLVDQQALFQRSAKSIGASAWIQEFQPEDRTSVSGANQNIAPLAQEYDVENEPERFRLEFELPRKENMRARAYA